MQKKSRLFDDMARIITGAGNLAFDVKREAEAGIARKLEVFLNKTSLVGRDEFEAVKQMAGNLKAENAELARKIAELQQKSVD
jgi:BMFP domain-containing protein YqiC